MPTFRTDSLIPLRDRMASAFNPSNPVVSQTLNLYEKVNSLISILERKDIGDREKFRLVQEFEGKNGTLADLYEQILKQAGENSQAGFSARAAEGNMALVTDYISYHETDFQPFFSRSPFNLQRVFSRLSSEDEINKALFSTIDNQTLKPIFPTQKSRDKHKEKIINAQKLMEKFLQKDHKIVLSELADADFKTLKEGIEAMQFLLVNLNNYLTQGGKNPIKPEHVEIKQLKEEFEKFTPLIRVREGLKDKQTASSYQKAVPNMASVKTNPAALTSLLKAKREEMAGLKENASILITSSSLLSEMSQSVMMVQKEYAAMKRGIWEVADEARLSAARKHVEAPSMFKPSAHRRVANVKENRSASENSESSVGSPQSSGSMTSPSESSPIARRRSDSSDGSASPRSVRSDSESSQKVREGQNVTPSSSPEKMLKKPEAQPAKKYGSKVVAPPKIVIERPLQVNPSKPGMFNQTDKKRSDNSTKTQAFSVPPPVNKKR